MQTRRARRPRHNNDAALECAAGVDSVDGAPDARALLTDGDIDADDVARLLIDDRVDRDRGLADGTVADDELRAGRDRARIAYRPRRDRSGPAGSRDLGRRSPAPGARSVPACLWRRAPFRPAGDRANRRRGRAVPVPLGRARHRPCRVPCRRPRSCRRRLTGRSRPGRARAPGRSRTVPCRSTEARRAGRWAVRRRARCHPDLLDPADLLGLRHERSGAKFCARVLEPGVRSAVGAACHARGPRGFVLRSARQLLVTTRWGPCSSRPAMRAGPP